MRLLLGAAVVAALAAALAGSGCGASRARSPAIAGGRLTIYSSQPLSGVEAARGRDVVRAERLALREAGGRVRRWRIVYVALDDAEPRAGGWSPGQVSLNAHRAAANPTTIAYLGELDSGASAVSIPVLNQRGILTVSPLDGVAGLTRATGDAPGEPAKYYPSGRRTFARLAPPDDVQAAALVFYMQDLGVRRVFVAHDDSLFGSRLALAVVRAARGAGIAVPASQAIEPAAVDLKARASLAARTRAARAGAFLYAGQLASPVAPLMAAVHRAVPRAALIVPSSLAAVPFARRLGAAASRTRVTAPWLSPWVLPPQARRFRQRFRAAYGAEPDPAAVYGYEAMRAVLAAVRRAGRDANRRATVVAALLGGPEHASPLGRYRIDRGGDTTLQTYGAYRVVGGQMRFDRVLDPLGA